MLQRLESSPAPPGDSRRRVARQLLASRNLPVWAPLVVVASAVRGCRIVHGHRAVGLRRRGCAAPGGTRRCGRARGPDNARASLSSRCCGCRPTGFSPSVAVSLSLAVNVLLAQLNYARISASAVSPCSTRCLALGGVAAGVLARRWRRENEELDAPPNSTKAAVSTLLGWSRRRLASTGDRRLSVSLLVAVALLFFSAVHRLDVDAAGSLGLIGVLGMDYFAGLGAAVRTAGDRVPARSPRSAGDCDLERRADHLHHHARRVVDGHRAVRDGLRASHDHELADASWAVCRRRWMPGSVGPGSSRQEPTSSPPPE